MSHKNSIAAALFVVALFMGAAHVQAASSASTVPTVDLKIDNQDGAIAAGNRFVSWSGSNLLYVNIYVSDGMDQYELDGLPASGGEFLYIPQPVNAHGGYVIIIGFSGSGSASDQVFIIPADIKVLEPNANSALWQEGQAQVVTFDFPRYDADVFSAHLENLYFPGMKYPLTLADIAKTARSAAVTAPGPLVAQLISDRPAYANEWDIRESFVVVVTGYSVSENGRKVVSESQSDIFGIAPAPTVLSIQYPTAGTAVEVGTQFPIVWKMTGNGDVGISIIGSDGETSDPLVVPNAGSYVVTAPSTPGRYTVELDEQAKGGGASASVTFTVVAKPVDPPSAPDELEVIVRRSTTAAGRPTVIFVPKSLPEDYGFSLKLQSGKGVGTLKAADLFSKPNGK